ncbi:MAG: NAD-dependent epimerase/dehydratase family protein [Planctomycetota bacterium]
MRVVLTGAGGLIGRAAWARLRAAGHEVTGVLRPGGSPGLEAGVELDLARPWSADDPRLPARCDALVYLAQGNAYRALPESAAEVFQVNVGSLATALSYARRAGATRAVVASSGSVYAPASEPLREDAPLLASGAGAALYGWSRRSGEEVARSFAEHLALTILRPFWVYGPGARGQALVPDVIARVREGREVTLQGADGPRIQPTWVADAAAAVAAALEREVQGTFNVAGPASVTLRELAEAAGACFGARPRFTSRPGEPAQVRVDVGPCGASWVSSPATWPPASRACAPPRRPGGERARVARGRARAAPGARRRAQGPALPHRGGGNPQELSANLRALGWDSRSWTLEPNRYGYPADEVLWEPDDSALLRELKRLRAIWRAARDHDVVHFNFGTTLAAPFGPWPPGVPGRGVAGRLRAVYTAALQRVELELYRRLGRTLFVHYQGDDARQGDYCRANFAVSVATQVDERYYFPASDAFKRRQIALLARYCAKVYALNPDLLHVLPPQAEFLPYGNISIADLTPVYGQEHPGPLRIAHAPTHRRAKGTPEILAALERLRGQGLEFELVLVEGLSHPDALRRYAEADVVVDQLYAGWYGGLAVEVMALGKPVLCYLREGDLGFLPPAMRAELPLLNVAPDTVEAGLRQVLELPRAELVAWGRRSRAFVERWHDPREVARRVAADYRRALAQGA